MRMPPPARKAGLALHVVTSVGWAGGVLFYLGLAVAAFTADDIDLQRAGYLSMDWAAWRILVPLAVASLITGVVQALATPWGLFRHYWVLVKLVITLVATIVLLAYTQTLAAFADAAQSPLAAPGRGLLRTPSVVLHSAVALVLLLTATVVAIFKPAGLTRHGQRQRRRGA